MAAIPFLLVRNYSALSQSVTGDGDASHGLAKSGLSSYVGATKKMNQCRNLLDRHAGNANHLHSF